jgi:tight adherence protein B
VPEVPGGALLGAVLAAVVALLLLRPPPEAPPVTVPAAEGGALAGRRGGTSLTVQLVTVVAGVVLVAALPLRRALLAAVLVLVALAVVRAVSRRRIELEAAERRTLVVQYAEALVGELRAGMPVGTALDRAAGVWPEASPVSAAARWGADVPDALRNLGRRPGAESVSRLAAVWQLCAGSGSSLAVGVGHVLETARAEQATLHVVAAELASARATARMLGVMPALVLLAGQGIGAEPWRFLLDTLPGLACLAGGAGFAVVGLAWMDRIAERAVRGSR